VFIGRSELEPAREMPSAEEHSERLRTLSAQCRKHRRAISAERKFLEGFVYLPPQRLAYCHVPKAASTWWLSILETISDDNTTRRVFDEDDGDDALHRRMLHGVRKGSELPDDVFKFTFVRHPFRRIVSAYHNKFVLNRDQKFIKPLLRYLRRKSKDALGNTTTISFPLFVDFVLDEVSRDRVSFGTFHWMPIHRLCQFCQVQ
jgi:hypothetical protein